MDDLFRKGIDLFNSGSRRDLLDAIDCFHRSTFNPTSDIYKVMAFTQLGINDLNKTIIKNCCDEWYTITGIIDTDDVQELSQEQLSIDLKKKIYYYFTACVLKYNSLQLPTNTDHLERILELDRKSVV